MKIVFMGTPDFAVPCLQALLDHPYEVVGVFTQPDKPKGRGYQLTPPPVKELAVSKGIPVSQPSTLRDGTALEQLKIWKPDLIVVVAYGKFLPKEILELPRLGCINVHASLLPKYRGAGPIQWAILNGETVTGVTTMYMAEGMDTGDMLERASLEIGPDETADELHDRLSVLGAKLLLSTVDKAEKGTLQPEKQDDSLASYAPMLTKDLSHIDFSQPAQKIHNQIRGLSSWPAAYTSYQGKRLKVYKSRLLDGSGEPGLLMDPKRMIVACGEGAIELVEVQYEGSRKMSGEEFLRGKKPAEKEFLG